MNLRLLISSGPRIRPYHLSWRGLLSNWSANTDPHLQEAASPHGSRSGCLQRYMALASHA